MEGLGILLAIGAALSWGVGDFFIQRGSRQYGIIETLFFIGGFGAIVLLPFAWGSLDSLLTPGTFALLSAAFLFTLLASLTNFTALRDGKLSVIEPVMSLELPLVIIIGVFLLGENLSSAQLLAMVVAAAAILLAVTERISLRMEKGALLALSGALFLALTDVFTGIASQHTSPVMAMWTINVGLTASSALILIAQGTKDTLINAVRHHPRTVLAQAVLDNAGWLCFAAAAVLLPISVALTISEGYIIISVLLGIFINHERLLRHQYFGVGAGILAIITLALVS